MKNSFVLLVGFAIAAVLLSHMFLYQVRYDQVAVRTTFDKADETSVQDTPGLKWRWPWPINKVTLYPKRLPLLEDKIEELQTSDGKSVIVRTYLTWRIADPLKFYITLKDPSEAARQLSSRLREVRGLISGYRFDELVNESATTAQRVTEHLGVTPFPSPVTLKWLNRRRLSRPLSPLDALVRRSFRADMRATEDLLGWQRGSLASARLGRRSLRRPAGDAG